MEKVNTFFDFFKKILYNTIKKGDENENWRRDFKN